MLKTTHRTDAALRWPGAPVLRIVPAGRLPLSGVLRGTTPQRGIPRTAEEWTALVKVGSGERDLPPSQCARLRELGLVVTVAGVPTLTRHGRITLGLPE